MTSIDDFWRVDDLIKSKWGKDAYKFIDYCGLEPIRPMENFGYFCTPENSKTFAATGGDGVHFGIVDGKNDNGMVGPIVMTVPMADIQNVIVAEDLEEFFRLGYHVGWFSMEQLVYNLDSTLEYYSKPDEEMTEEETRFLELLRNELNMETRPLTKERLATLEMMYFGRLKVGTSE